MTTLSTQGVTPYGAGPQVRGGKASSDRKRAPGGQGGAAEQYSEAWVVSTHTRVPGPSRLLAVPALSRPCHLCCKHQPQNPDFHKILGGLLCPRLGTGLSQRGKLASCLGVPLACLCPVPLVPSTSPASALAHLPGKPLGSSPGWAQSSEPHPQGKACLSAASMRMRNPCFPAPWAAPPAPEHAFCVCPAIHSCVRLFASLAGPERMAGGPVRSRYHLKTVLSPSRSGSPVRPVLRLQSSQEALQLGS